MAHELIQKWCFFTYFTLEIAGDYQANNQSTYIYVCARFIFVRFSPRLSTHTAPTAVPTGPAYAQIAPNPSRAVFAVHRSEFVETAAAPYVFTGMITGFAP